MKKVLMRATLASMITALTITPMVSAESFTPQADISIDSSQLSETTAALKVVNDSVVSLNVNGRSYQFNLSEEVQGQVTENQLAAIAKQAEQAGAGANPNITIEAIGGSNGSNSLQEQNSNPFELYSWGTINWNYVYSNITHDNVGAAQEIISVPRGGSVKLTKTKTLTTSASISYAVETTPSPIKQSLSGTFNRTISDTFTTEEVYNGPSEGSSAISRRFMWTPYYDAGSWRADGYEVGTNKYYNTYTGRYTQPTRTLVWSMEVK